MSARILSLEEYRDKYAGRFDTPDLEHPLMIDWVKVSQVHGSGLNLPIINSGWRTDEDADGTINWTCAKKLYAEGSFDSLIKLSCDGNRVEFDGNIARWDRPDNVFGYTWPETVERINRFLESHGLPPFSAGKLLRFADTGWQWTGARCSRIDITCNYATFSEQDAFALIRLLGQHHVGRQKGRVTEDSTTVLYGYGTGNNDGSSYISGKVYIKHTSIQQLRKRKGGRNVGQDVYEFCRDMGVLREEFTLKSQFLTEKNLCWYGELNQDVLFRVFRSRTQMRRLAEMTYPDTSELSSAVRGTLARYEKGEPLNLKRRSFYNHRRELLKYGVDIGVPRSLQPLPQKIRTIELVKLVAPDWYREKYG